MLVHDSLPKRRGCGRPPRTDNAEIRPAGASADARDPATRTPPRRRRSGHGARGRARIQVGLPCSSAVRANLLEDEADELPVAGGTIQVGYRPHEIVTVLVR
ncbi:MAG TPA: glycosyl hydrolase-related protein [Gaiellales bacterium]|nr:glycosyl hydrolase-related protein [Gaiellales bacterium]